MKTYDYATTTADAGYGQSPDPEPPYDDPTWDLRAAVITGGRVLWFWQKEQEKKSLLAASDEVLVASERLKGEEGS